MRLFHLPLILFLFFSHAAFAKETYGVISGKLGYPGESIPNMKICVENLDNKKIICTQLSPREYNEGKYHWQLPIGKYFIFAKLLKAQGKFDTNYRAYYSEFVTCGEKSTCQSHEPIAVTVENNMTLNNINPTDWYK